MNNTNNPSVNLILNIIKGLNGDIIPNKHITFSNKRWTIPIDVSNFHYSGNDKRDKFRTELLNSLLKNHFNAEIKMVGSTSGFPGVYVIIENGLNSVYIYFKDKSGLKQAGAGSKITKIMEEGQAFVCSNDLNIHKCKDYFEKNEVPEEWQESLLKSGKLILDFCKNSGKYYRSDSSDITIKSIYNTFKRFRKGFNVNVNKWNPSDIWFVSNTAKNSDIKKSLDSCSTLLQFNMILKKLFTNKEVIGISLKKATKPVLYVIDNSKNKLDLSIYKDVKFFYNSPDIFFGMPIYMGINLGKKSEYIQFRMFGSNAGSFQGEYNIKGTESHHGKIGNGSILNILKKDMNINLKTTQDIYKDIEKNESEMLKNLYNLFNSMSSKIDIKFPSKYEDFLKNYIKLKEPKRWLFTKYYGLYMAAEVMKANKVSEFFARLVEFGSSHSGFSSIYCKVSDPGG